MTDPWVRIAGSGPVGLACALFMVRRGVPASRILLDPAPGLSQTLAPGLAARVLAISEGSCQLLSRIIELPAAGLIGRVEVSLFGHLGRTRIDACDLGVSALGRVIRYGSLLEALRQRASLHEWSDAPADTDTVAVTVHAEGDTGDDARVREFHQSALLGEVHAPHAPASRQSVAFERFTPNGPLALLPLPFRLRTIGIFASARTRAIS
jgi:2-octaprenyl-6-methoxyphenol hydroxylase